MASHFRTLRIKDIRMETSECISIAFEIPDELKEEFVFVQGQNITLKARVNNEELRRSYSICSSPLDQELRVAVKRIPAGRFSSFVHEQLKIGDELQVLAPTGQFFSILNPPNRKNYVAWTAGSGITPLLSIIKTTLLTERYSRFSLIYGNRNHQSVIFKEELDALKNRFMDRLSLLHLFSREETESPVNQGRIDSQKCIELWQKLPWLKHADEHFICGPAEMIFTVKRFLENNSVPSAHIHFELFSVPGSEKKEITKNAAPIAAVNHPETSSLVNIRLDGIVFSFRLAYDGPSILDAALSQGADLPFSCKGGVCATCRARLLEGNVKMDNNYALEKEELNAGFILTCQAHPRSASLLVDFDKRI